MKVNTTLRVDRLHKIVTQLTINASDVCIEGEQRAAIRFLWSEGVLEAEIYRRLVSIW